MKNGFRVYDSDTHVMPAAEVLERYVDPGFRPRLAELAAYRAPIRQSAEHSGGGHAYRVNTKYYRRILGEAAPREDHSGRESNWRGSKLPRPGVQDDQAANRVKDMDDEGTDVHFLIPSSWVGTVGLADPSLEVGLSRAYHRHMADFCGRFPNRLKGLIRAPARDVTRRSRKSANGATHPGRLPSSRRSARTSRPTTPISSRSGAPPLSTACRSCITARPGTRPITPAISTSGTTFSLAG
jgi:hypothetical protein